jgi:DNA-binding MarR family transcriptional regulator
VLALLRANPQGLRLGALAEQLGVTAATTSDSVTALHRKGLVTKEPAADDGRGVVVLLTSTGSWEAAAAAAWPDFLLEAVGELSAAEQAGFLRVLIAMIRTLQEKRRIPVARMCVSCRFFRPMAHDDPVHPHHCASSMRPLATANYVWTAPITAPHPPTRLPKTGKSSEHPTATDPRKTPWP